MSAAGKTDSKAMLLTWTLRNLKSTWDHQRRDAVAEITYSDDPQFLPLLLELLASDPLYPRPHEIAVALRSYDEAAVPLVLETLVSSDARARFHAALVLRGLADERAVRPLIAALESDTDESVRRTAAQALGGIHDLRAFVPLVRALDRDPAIAACAAQALARFGDRQAIRAWMEEVPGIQDIDGKLALIQDRSHAEQLTEVRHSDDLRPAVVCDVCGAALPWLSNASVPSSSHYGGAYCMRCHSHWCFDCLPTEVERGQHRRCGGQSAEFSIKR